MTSTNRKRWISILTATMVLVVGLLAGSAITAYTSWSPFRNPRNENRIPVYVAADTSSPGVSASKDFSLDKGLGVVAQSARKSVVSIISTKIVRQELPSIFNDPFFRRFFGPEFNFPQEQRETALGSGVIVSPDGYILTNNHVVEGAKELKIKFADRRDTVEAEIVGTDAPTDVAVIKVDAKDLPAMPLGDSEKVHVGDFVLAIGNPFGLGHTVTFGIISATGRGNLGIAQYEDFIQTDAAINPGNSGGALVDMHGRLIGINTAILSRVGGNQGIGFAIPINMARAVMDQILKQGRVIRGYLGLLPQDVTSVIAEKFGLKEARGALVGSVESGTPADRAGIRRGDIILEFNGHPIEDADDLRNLVAMTPPGTKVTIKVFRNGEEKTLTATLAERPETPQRQPGQQFSRQNPLSGIEVDELTPALRRRLGLPPDAEGVVITRVAPSSSAAEAGLEPGDVIQEIDRQPIRSVADFRRAAARAEGKSVLLLIFNPRTNMTQFVVLEPQK